MGLSVFPLAISLMEKINNNAHKNTFFICQGLGLYEKDWCKDRHNFLKTYTMTVRVNKIRVVLTLNPFRLTILKNLRNSRPVDVRLTQLAQTVPEYLVAW